MNSPDATEVRIDAAAGDADMAIVRELFREYEASIGTCLCFQDFDAELANLPGKYVPPEGDLLLARDGDAVAACVGFWKRADGVAEMKRLYVRPRWQGSGLGRRLAEQVVAAARGRGYAALCLDTLPSMAAAQGLYRSMGFRETSPYYRTPIDGTLFMELPLSGEVQA